MLRASLWLIVTSVVLVAGMIAATEYVEPSCDAQCQLERARRWEALDGR